MRSKNWCCKLCWPVIRKDITRFWPVWGSYLAIWLLILPIPLFTALMEGYVDLGNVHRLIVNSGVENALVMCALYGGFAAFAVWSYLYQGRSASLYHALPLRRESLFLSHYTAGLGFLLVPNVLVAVLSYLCQLALRDPNPTMLLQWLAIVCLKSLLFYSIGTLAAMCTGSLPAMPVLYGLFNFTFVVCETLLIDFACSLYYGVQEVEQHLTFLSPFIHLLNQDATVYRTVSGNVTQVQQIRYFQPTYFRPLLLYALAAVGLTLAALWLYRRRATESAGDIIAEPLLRPLAKYAFTIGCALVLGWIFDQILFPFDTTALSLIASCALGAFIGWVAAGMLLAKSFRVFKPKKFLGLLPVLALIVVWVVCVELDVLNIEHRIPATDEVRQVEIHCDEKLVLTDPADIEAIRTLHKEILTAGEDDYDLPKDQNWLHLSLDYDLKNGQELRRSYRIPYSTQLAAYRDQPASIIRGLMEHHRLEAFLPPAAARFESIELNLRDRAVTLAGVSYRIDDSQYDPYYCPIYLPHADRLMQALREDVLAGRIGVWGPTWDKRESLMSFSFNYSLSIDGVESSTRWHNLTIWADQEPTATLETLLELGYLKKIP